MRIFLACPAPPLSLRGNRVTAVRWARLLRHLGHRVAIKSAWTDQPCDLMIALHARRSYQTIAAYRKRHRRRPLVVCLTGTDVYHDLPRSRRAQQVLDWADRIVVLQAKALDELKPAWRVKTRVIHQSVLPLARRPRLSQSHFDVCVLGHLRDEKDPLRAALALEHLSPYSRVRLTHAGRAMTPAWATQAKRLMRRQPRYRWLGEVSRTRARRLLARSHAMVISSRLEGGANVVSEAIVLGVPVLASRIPGNVGLLGDDYLGYYPVGEERALALLMEHAATEPGFYRRLQLHVQSLQPLFRPEAEQAAWQELLKDLA
jgi:putative glycosyltransferase (TIGR04348 family)